MLGTCRTITGSHTEILRSHANDCKKAIASGALEVSLGVRGSDEVKQENESNAARNEALKAAKHAAKALRIVGKKVDKSLKSLTVMLRQFNARAKMTEDPDVQKFQEASEDLQSIVKVLNRHQEEAEEMAIYVDELVKNGPDKEAEDKEQALKTFEKQCEIRAKQCDSWRKAGDVHAKEAGAKVAEMQGKLLRDPSEWI